MPWFAASAIIREQQQQRVLGGEEKWASGREIARRDGVARLPLAAALLAPGRYDLQTLCVPAGRAALCVGRKNVPLDEEVASDMDPSSFALPC